jgi:flagellar biosynthesis protein FlhF
MSIKRYVAPTTREAMMQVRRELGDDAVIIANRRVGNRIEILAAAPDAVAALVERSEVRDDPRAAPPRDLMPPERVAGRADARPKVEAFQDFVRRQMQAEAGQQPARAAARDLNARTTQLPAARPLPSNAAGNSALAMYQDVADIEDDVEFGGAPLERAPVRRGEAGVRGMDAAPAPRRSAERDADAAADAPAARATRAATLQRSHRAAQVESDARADEDAALARGTRASTLARSHRAQQIETPEEPAVFRRRPAHVAPAARPEEANATSRSAPAATARPAVDIVLEPSVVAAPVSASTAQTAATPVSTPAERTPEAPAAPIASGHAAVPALPMRSQTAPIATAARLREASINAAQAARALQAVAAAQAQAAALAAGNASAAPAASEAGASQANNVTQANTAMQASAAQSGVAAQTSAVAQANAIAQPAGAQVNPAAQAKASAEASPSVDVSAAAHSSAAAPASVAAAHGAPSLPERSSAGGAPDMPAAAPAGTVAVTTVAVEPVAVAMTLPKAVTLGAAPAGVAETQSETQSSSNEQSAPVVQVAAIAPAMLAIETRASAVAASAWDMPFARPVARSTPRSPAPQAPESDATPAQPAAASQASQAQPGAAAAQPLESELLAELRSMRDILREQIASFAAKPVAVAAVASTPANDPTGTDTLEAVATAGVIAAAAPRAVPAPASTTTSTAASAAAAPAGADSAQRTTVSAATAPSAPLAGDTHGTALPSTPTATPSDSAPEATALAPAPATASGAAIAASMPVVQSGTGVRVMTRLLTAGFSADVARRIAARAPAQSDPAQAEEWLQEVIAHNVRSIEPGDGIVERAARPASPGQVFALIGPTGVGKTTTVAKLAARFAVRHGTSALGLITLDAYRVAAPEQLRAYGRILGTPVHVAQDAATLRELLATMVHKRLVLIDTCGLSQRDERLGEMLDLLAAAGSATRPIRRVLLMNSASHAETLDDAARAWRAGECTGAILTKLDEAARIGGSLDVTLRHRLTLLGLTNGQRVPEDWHAANSRLLAHLALKPAAQLFELADEEGAALIDAHGRTATVVGTAHG